LGDRDRRSINVNGYTSKVPVTDYAGKWHQSLVELTRFTLLQEELGCAGLVKYMKTNELH